jgi:citrate synthase
MTASGSTYVPGLEGIVAAQTSLSHVDGEAGELIIGGYPLMELAPWATFEEAAFLLWHGRLPTVSELAALRARFAGHQELPGAVMDLLRAAAEGGAPVIDVVRMGAATLSLSDPEPTIEDAEHQLWRAEALCAAFPVLVAAYWRIRRGEAPVAPDAAIGHAANYLQMLTGKSVDPDFARALETYLVTVLDHGMNASTFTARVIMSTNSDIYSAVTGAVGALKGPAHGGAPGPALDMVFEIGSPENAEPNIRARLERGERLMGFGHRVYKVRDPRADALAMAAERLYERAGDRSLYQLARSVETTVLRLLEEYKPGRRLQTNVEFYTALVLHGVGLPTELFTPTFAIGRVGGWTAHCIEQLRHNRLIRPASEYVGPTDRRWTPIEERDAEMATP